MLQALNLEFEQGRVEEGVKTWLTCVLWFVLVDFFPWKKNK